MKLNESIRNILKEEVSKEVQKKLANSLLKRSYNLRYKQLTNLRNDGGKLANNGLGENYEKFLDKLYGYLKNDKLDDLSNALRIALSTDKTYIEELGKLKYYNMLLSEMDIRRSEAIKYFITSSELSKRKNTSLAGVYFCSSLNFLTWSMSASACDFDIPNFFLSASRDASSSLSKTPSNRASLT